MLMSGNCIWALILYISKLSWQLVQTRLSGSLLIISWQMLTINKLNRRLATMFYIFQQTWRSVSKNKIINCVKPQCRSNNNILITIFMGHICHSNDISIFHAGRSLCKSSHPPLKSQRSISSLKFKHNNLRHNNFYICLLLTPTLNFVAFSRSL